MKRLLLAFAFILAYGTSAWTQTPTVYTQNIKGIVRDADSKASLVGAAVVVAGTNPIVGSVTDTEGVFKIEKLPIGRYDLQISFLGYAPTTIPQVLVTSGKEVFLTIDLTESVLKLDAVVSHASRNNQLPLNEMATLSARSFSVEETNRYSGTFSDPARMAANYAGVASAGDLGNEIVIRGNAPKGILWRLEGIEIPNPNHFSQLGGSGGGVSMLSAGTLSNSDFYTGAFPAEFGNAASGVFDLKLRNGNSDRREFAFQAGALGLEVNTEGYFKAAKNGGQRATYLFNYRYSTTGIIAAFVPFLKEFVPKYQDASFKINVPTAKFGVFALFGLGGRNISAKDAVADSTKWTSSDDDESFSDVHIVGVLGASHKYFFSDKTYLNTVVALSRIGGTATSSELDKRNNYREIPTQESNLYGNDSRANIFLNHKFNAQHTVRFGGVWTHTNYRLASKFLENKKWVVPYNSRGNGDFFQIYGQWKYRLTGAWTLNTGVHYARLLLNNTDALEPRAALQWQMNPRQKLAISAGLHSRPEHYSVYLLEVKDKDGKVTKPHRSLKIPKAAHFVLGYDHNLGGDWRVKAEAYYQYLYDSGVEPDSNRAFSMLNQSNTWDLFGAKPLVSTGTGRNMGVDLTLEKFFSKNYYAMLTATLFDARFEDAKGKTFNSFYNYRYVVNVLGGRDFKVGKYKRHIMSVNGKFILRGGNRYTPINLAASQKQKRDVRILERRFEARVPAYWRIDWGVRYKINRAHLTHTWLIDIQNTLNRQNVAFQYFDVRSNSLKYNYQLGILPNMSYRIEF